VFRSSLPESERLSVEQLVGDLNKAGKEARHFEDTKGIIETIVAEHQPGDVVLIMSNGGFDNIHRRLVDALQHSDASQDQRPVQ
jgi:UDP-N-acetylmuramate: L-alanyl-gamma-D-glutamyl-meso-diaminopimelate ligase